MYQRLGIKDNDGAPPSGIGKIFRRPNWPPTSKDGFANRIPHKHGADHGMKLLVTLDAFMTGQALHLGAQGSVEWSGYGIVTRPGDKEFALEQFWELSSDSTAGNTVLSPMALATAIGLAEKEGYDPANLRGWVHAHCGNGSGFWSTTDDTAIEDALRMQGSDQAWQVSVEFSGHSIIARYDEAGKDTYETLDVNVLLDSKLFAAYERAKSLREKNAKRLEELAERRRKEVFLHPKAPTYSGPSRRGEKYFFRNVWYMGYSEAEMRAKGWRPDGEEDDGRFELPFSVKSLARQGQSNLNNFLLQPFNGFLKFLIGIDGNFQHFTLDPIVKFQWEKLSNVCKRAVSPR